MTAKTLPERLRHYTADTQLADNYCEDMHAAADELERLRMDLENTRSEAVLAVATERERWRAAVEGAAYYLEKARVWNGTEWHYNALHPMFYKPAIDRLREVLGKKQ